MGGLETSLRPGPPDRLKRSGGVTASAVIAFLGSGLVILVGGLTLFAGMLASRAAGHQPTGAPAIPTPPPFAVMVILSSFYLGFGAWGIASAIGILRLRNWARICFVVFGGLLTAGSLCGAFGMALAMVVMPKTLPSGQNVPPGMVTAIFGIFLVFALVFAAVGIGWVIFFNRRNVRSQFVAEMETTAPETLPVSITIIACYSMVGVVGIPFSFFSTYPAFLLGFLVRGWPARLLLLAIAGVSVYAGVGMLRRKPVAYTVAVVTYSFGLLNFGLSLVSGSAARMIEAVAESSGSSAPTGMLYPFMRFGMIAGFLIAAVILWFLITRRQAFLRACAAAESAVRAQ